MRLYELRGLHGTLPTVSGVARLKWDNSCEFPIRKGGDIILPDNTEAEFFPLHNGSQFLFSRMSKRGTTTVHFGGTDEQPFLVELERDVLYKLNGGEDAFYAALKPTMVLYLESCFNILAKRQGDWFCVPLPRQMKWKQAIGMVMFACDKAGSFHGYDQPQVYDTTEKGKFIGGTRHRICGGRFMDGAGDFFLAEGTLRAPDHNDLVLNGPHALFQTAYLVDPEKAD